MTGVTHKSAAPLSIQLLQMAYPTHGPLLMWQTWVASFLMTNSVPHLTAKLVTTDIGTLATILPLIAGLSLMPKLQP